MVQQNVKGCCSITHELLRSTVSMKTLYTIFYLVLELKSFKCLRCWEMFCRHCVLGSLKKLKVLSLFFFVFWLLLYLSNMCYVIGCPMPWRRLLVLIWLAAQTPECSPGILNLAVTTAPKLAHRNE